MNDLTTVAQYGLMFFIAIFTIGLIMSFAVWVCKTEKRKSIALFIVFAYLFFGVVYAIGNMIFSKPDKDPSWKHDQEEEQYNRRLN